ncbi:MAG TPA: hypothetical protein VEB64_15120 [Azospirillaceae bacterium]|nr:hypothetical protein [Azospirillaceae bacterium]
MPASPCRSFPPLPLYRRVPALAALAVAFSLAACANQQADQALYAQTALVGMPKKTLLSCAGVPARSATVDNAEYYTYRSGRVVSYPSSSVGVWSGGYSSGLGVGVGLPLFAGNDVHSYDCEATFSLRNGVVERIVYGGTSGGSSRLSQCYAIVENCLALIPQQTRAPAPATAPPPAPPP